MSDRPFTRADLEALRRFDTPTICNGLEIVVPERRAIGFTVEPMVAADRDAAADRGPRAGRHDPCEGGAARPGREPARTGTTTSPMPTCRPSW